MLAGTRVTYGKTRSHGLRAASYHVIYSFLEESVGTAAAALGLRVIRHLLPPERAATTRRPSTSAPSSRPLIRLAQRRRFGPRPRPSSPRQRAGHPMDRLNDRSLVQLGHGRYQRASKRR